MLKMPNDVAEGDDRQPCSGGLKHFFHSGDRGGLLVLVWRAQSSTRQRRRGRQLCGAAGAECAMAPRPQRIPSAGSQRRAARRVSALICAILTK